MAREILLHDAGEDTIHANEIKLVTPQQKRRNWWYYHRTPLIVGILAFALVFSLVYSIVSKVKPDYTIALLTSYSMPESGTSELERCIAAYADDRNGDGQVKILVSNYVFSSTAAATAEEAQQREAEMVRFVADCTTNESIIFLHDEEAFDCLKDNFEGVFQYNDGTAMPDDAKDYENAMRPISEFRAFSEFQPVTEADDPFTPDILRQLYDKLRVSLRTAEGSSIERSEKDMAYYEDSLKLHQCLETAEPPEKGEG